MTLVLLVDDSPTMRNQIRRVLQESLGIEGVVEAKDGLEGFKLMVEHRPDLVVCDLIMPGFDGLKFLSLRATRSDLSHIPVIMLTSESDLDRKVEVLETT
jgi:two-component system, cell cycle response regulator